MKNPKSINHLDPKLRFNWGYWDGALMAARGELRAPVTVDGVKAQGFDAFYAHGFFCGTEAIRAGVQGVGAEALAWDIFLSTTTDPALLNLLRAEVA